MSAAEDQNAERCEHQHQRDEREQTQRRNIRRCAVIEHDVVEVDDVRCAAEREVLTVDEGERRAGRRH